MGRERGVVGSAGSLAEKAVNLYGSALYVGHVYYFHELFFQLHIALTKKYVKTAYQSFLPTAHGFLCCNVRRF